MAWHWPEAAQTFQRHRSQLAVIIERGPGSAIHKSLLLSRLVALLGADFDYLAVYWDAATMVHAAEVFTAAASQMSPRSLPLRLWVDFRFIPDDDGSLTLVTFGLRAFDLFEIEIRSSARSAAVLLRLAFNLAYHQLDGGVVEDDQTIGRDDDERILVRHERSMFDPERTVLSLKA